MKPTKLLDVDLAQIVLGIEIWMKESIWLRRRDSIDNCLVMREESCGDDERHQFANADPD